MRVDILSMTLDELHGLMDRMNEPAYRAVQIFEWLHRRGAGSFDDMDNLPKSLRASLMETAYITTCRIVDVKKSIDGTQKFLFELFDVESDLTESVLIETVLMDYSFGRSICISTQAGCRMGCKFCASAEDGLIRNLTAGEMCAQIYATINAYATVNAHAAVNSHATINATDDAKEKISRVVLMGCGEPFDNFDNTIKLLKLIGHPKGQALGARNITLSTCGLVPQIRAFADMKLQVNLAISLHGPTDEIRRDIMPIAKRYPIAELIDACRYYISLTNRRITFEYALIRGLNDSGHHAALLRELLSRLLCHVNLIPVNSTVDIPVNIPVNPNPARGYLPTQRREAEAFAAILNKGGIPATIRRTIGHDVDAACGQLRAQNRVQNRAHQ